jgi:hypothetical protein
VKTSVLFAVLFAAYAAQAQNLKVIALRFPANGSTPSTIEFLCSHKYERTKCVKDATALRHVMAPYPLQLLERWSFVLVAADDWKALVRSQGGDPVTPAFSILDQRATLLDSSLFGGFATRNKELEERFGMIGPALLNLAISHEIGHGICQETNERRADDYGKELRDGKIPHCAETKRRKPSSDTKNVATSATADTPR